MIKKLQKKFILINMAFISIIMAAVMFIMCYSSYTRSRDELNRTLQNVSAERTPGNRVGFRPDHKEPDEDVRRFFNPFTILTLNQDLEITDKSEVGITLDDDEAQVLSHLVAESSSDSGKLQDYELLYKKVSTDTGSKIILVDYSYSRNSLIQQLIHSLLIFLGADAAFFVLSFYLSRWALRPVEKAWAQQNQFVADASHELKTPITIILANLGILASHREDSIQKQYKWLINTKDEAERMKQLVEDLLFLAKSDASMTPLVLSAVDFSDLIWGRLLPFESVAFEQDVTLDSSIPDHLMIHGHEGQLKQLVAILLDNACKYAGEHGRIQVRAWAADKMIHLQITNTGTPIPAEDLPHLFERFYRADKSRVRKEGGYGLGLAIAANIVSQNHGKIQVTSSEADGTRFTVAFPEVF